MNYQLQSSIFASQGFLIRTAPHEPLAYCAIKSRDFLHHVIYQPIYKSAKSWKMQYF